MYSKGRRGRDRMVVGFTTTCAISAYHNDDCEFEPRWWRGELDTTLCDKVCQWLPTGRFFFLQVLRFLQQIKLNRHYIAEILLKVALNTLNQPLMGFSFSYPIIQSFCMQKCILIVLQIINQWKRRGGISHFSNTNPL